MAATSNDPVIKHYREQISDNDVKILEALNKRVKLVKSLKDYKDAQGLSFYDAAQEDWVITYLCRANRGPLSNEGLREIYSLILQVAKREAAVLSEKDQVRGARSPRRPLQNETPAPRAPCAAPLLGEILGRHSVEEVLELLDDLLDVPHLLVELDAVGVEQALRGEDGGIGADGEGDGVGRPRVHVYLLAAGVEPQYGVERVVAEFGDEHAVDACLELVDDVGQKVVGHGAGKIGVLQLHEDGGSLRVADPYGQEQVAAVHLEKDDRLLAGRIETDAVDSDSFEALHHVLAWSDRGSSLYPSAASRHRADAVNYRGRGPIAQLVRAHP